MAMRSPTCWDLCNRLRIGREDVGRVEVRLLHWSNQHAGQGHRDPNQKVEVL